MKCKLSYSLNYIILILIISISWFLFYFLCNYYIESSKFRHYNRDYKHFLDTYNKKEQSSIKAKSSLRKWVSQTSKHSNLVLNLFNNISNPKYLCVAILSKNRINSNVNYINQAVLALITRTSIDTWKNITIIGFNTEDPPDQNQNLLDLADLIHIVNITTKIRHYNLRIKEAMDYALVLKHLYDIKCNYSFVMEDDAIVSYNWYNKLKISIDLIKNSKNWLCIKLFSGYKFFDWDWLWFPEQILKVLFYSIALSFANITTNNIIYLLVKNKDFDILKENIIYYFRPRSKIRIFVFLILILNSFTLVIIFKSTSINPTENTIREYRTGFGLVSVLIPHQNLHLFAQYLNETVHKSIIKNEKFIPKDLLIEIYRETNHFKEFIMEPSLVQHSGMHSSLYDRDTTLTGFKNLYKSYSFIDENLPIVFNAGLR